MDDEYYKSTAKGKLIFFLYILGAAAIYFLLKYLWFTYLPAPIEVTEESVNNYLQNVASAILCSGITALGIYIYFSRKMYLLSKRVKKYNQYPPPHSDFPFTLKILRNEKALKQAKGLIYGSFVLVLMGLLKLGASIYTAISLYEMTTSF